MYHVGDEVRDIPSLEQIGLCEAEMPAKVRVVVVNEWVSPIPEDTRLPRRELQD